MTGDTDTIAVEGLGDPGPELADALAAEQQEPPADEPPAPPDPAHRELMVESLTAAIEAPFAIVATRRGPHWRVSRDEARSVAEPLSLVIPANALTERLVAMSPWASAGVQLYALVQLRLEQDQALKENATDATPEPGPRRPPLRAVPDEGAAGAADGAAGQRIPGEPGPDGAGDGRQPFTGAGLGL